MGLFRRLFGIVFHPGRTFAGIIRQERLGGTLLYYLLLLLVPASILVIAGVVVYPLYVAPFLGERRALGWIGVAGVVPFVVVPAFAGLAIGGLILEPFVILLGGGRAFSQTLKALVYASTPLILSLWFPPLVGFTAIWSLALVVVGVQRTRRMPAGRAVVAVLLPWAVLTGALVVIGLAGSVRAA
jgi:hypothetical protein